MSEHLKLSKEERKAAIADYKAKKKAAKEKEKIIEAERVAFLRKQTPAEKKACVEEEKAKKAAATSAAEEKKKADKAKRQEAKAKEKGYLATLSKDEKKTYKAKKKAEAKAFVDKEFAVYKQKHAEEASAKLDALNSRYDIGGDIHRFWFKVGQSKFCQGYMNWWRRLNIAHPTLAKWLYQVFYFIVFSEGVTIWQYLVLTFLPAAFGIGLAGAQFMWPQIVLGAYVNPISGASKTLYWSILGYDVVYDNSGNVVIGGGLGYFLAFEIATFTAQCINFPLQRNITFKSHGNPVWQGVWYFVGWVGISFLCNMLNGLWLPFGSIYLSPAVYNILVMISTGGVSMVIFFFIFKIIFPAGEASQEKV